jgi:hypothetical protein
MVNEGLRSELLAMEAEDRRVRQELMDAGLLGGPYVPRMEAVHVKNAARLRELIYEYGWPAQDIAGEDGAKSAWFITQHAVGEPQFQREALRMVQACVAEGRVAPWNAAYLEDRIAMQEGRAQRYGTQWMDDEIDGRARPWKLAEPERVNELRTSVGLGPLHPIPERGPDLPLEKQQEMRKSYAWWEAFMERKGWRLK